MLRSLIMLLVLGLLNHAGADDTLGEMCARQDLFTLSTDAFAKDYAHKIAFNWTSVRKDGARAFGKMSLGELPVIEVIADFTENHVSGLYFSIYNRGDAGLIPQDRFNTLVEAGEAHFRELCGNKGSRRKRSGATRFESITWRNGKLVYRFEFDSTRQRIEGRRTFVPEFIRLRVFPHEKGKKLNSYGVSKNLISSAAIKDKVVKAENGDLYIDKIPMVDQGRKGYCACAATARVLQHYGREVDQHQIAQIALTGVEGTSPEALLKALKRMRTKLNLKLTIYNEFTIADFQRLIKEYNRRAKRAKVPTIRLARSGSVYIDQVYSRMRLDILKEICGRGSRIDRFEQNIQKNIEKGIPLLWGVMLGVVKEPGLPQAMGGHMRLIIGINQKKEEIIYSDSWGPGHELKRMPLKDAFAITTGLFGIRAY